MAQALLQNALDNALIFRESSKGWSTFMSSAFNISQSSLYHDLLSANVLRKNIGLECNNFMPFGETGTLEVCYKMDDYHMNGPFRHLQYFTNMNENEKSCILLIMMVAILGTVVILLTGAFIHQRAQLKDLLTDIDYLEEHAGITVGKLREKENEYRMSRHNWKRFEDTECETDVETEKADEIYLQAKGLEIYYDEGFQSI